MPTEIVKACRIMMVPKSNWDYTSSMMHRNNSMTNYCSVSHRLWNPLIPIQINKFIQVTAVAVLSRNWTSKKGGRDTE